MTADYSWKYKLNKVQLPEGGSFTVGANVTPGFAAAAIFGEGSLTPGAGMFFGTFLFGMFFGILRVGDAV